MDSDYAIYFPWRDNLNWFGLPWKPRSKFLAWIDERYVDLLMLVPLGGWHWKGWRILMVMRARFYCEFRHELECPEQYGRETLTYDFMNGIDAPTAPASEG